MSHYRQIAALGSSFAAGLGIQPVADPAAMRSRRNYAHLLADRLGAELVDLTVSGATTATILHTAQVTMTGAQYPPRSTRFPQIPTSSAVEAMARGLADLVLEVRNRAVDARVVLVDYLTVVADATRTDDDWPLSAEQTASVRAIQDGIARGYRIAADRADAEVLRASELGLDHGLGSIEPWVLGFQPTLETTAWSFHPNELGMAAVAVALAELLAVQSRGR